MIVRRVEALGKFLDTDDGKNLLAGTKRAANILRIEEKKDGKAYDGAPDAALYAARRGEGARRRDRPGRRRKPAPPSRSEDFAGAMSAMAKLRPRGRCVLRQGDGQRRRRQVRENRLKLLNEIRDATRAVADFSRIQD